MSSIEFYILLNMIGCLIDILGEKEVFTEEQYKRIKASMTADHDPKNTVDTLESILAEIRKEKKSNNESQWNKSN